LDDNQHWNTAKEYRSPLAAEVADLASIRSDLAFVIQAAELALLIPEPSGASGESPVDNVRRTSLWNSALVAYARCFGTGVRKVRLTEECFASLAEKTAQALVAHQYCIDTRNKYIAHSVNSFERAKVALLVGDGIHSDRGVVGAGSILIRAAAEAAENIRSLKNLARVLIRWVDAELHARVEAVVAEARAMDEGTLNNLPNVEFPLPVQPGEASKPRKR